MPMKNYILVRGGDYGIRVMRSPTDRVKNTDSISIVSSQIYFRRHVLIFFKMFLQEHFLDDQLEKYS
jgi:hypothetical protein